VNALDRNRSTALHAAATASRVDIVAILLEAGADPRLRDKQGYFATDLPDAWRWLP
jgi:ankyrin repeat protein